MADEISETGLWLTDDGKVVKSQPKGGATQLVREGGRVTPAVQARIDSLDTDPDADPTPAAVALGNDPAPVYDDDPDPGPVVTSQPSPTPAKRAAKKA